jgi:Xaa-Pro aminopeptidase
MNSSEEKLARLRAAMKEKGIDAYIIPVTDPHLGEYVPDHWKIIAWLTGFTGSAANVVVTKSFAGLWTDSRYFIQAEKQLRGSGFELVKLKIPHTSEYIEWLKENLKKRSSIAVDGRIFSIGSLKQLEKTLDRKEIHIDFNCDLISDLWTGRPSMSDAISFDHTVDYCGKTRAEKIAEVREQMKILNVKYHLLTSVDDIMWILNIRGNDVKYSPLLTSFAIVGEEQVLFFADERKISYNIASEFDKLNIVLLPYGEIREVLSTLPPKSSILITPGTTSSLLFHSIPKGMIILEDISIPTRLKAIKNNVEIENIRNVMIKDGVALTRFFFWLEQNIGQIEMTELSVADKLLELRMQQKNFLGPSFSTIAAYNAHSALPHYSATTETDSKLIPEGIFLLDSGGQYLDGTTDITRTISLGRPDASQKKDFTLALKGTISIARARFPYGTKGYQIDVLARKALWDSGLNYGHGTGHGVGFCLNVHEGPQSIGTGASGDLKTCLEPGMLTADEPAIYREGKYGFRTENLILCVDAGETEYGEFLQFETVSLCYIEKSLIVKELLNNEEIAWLNNYHSQVYEKLSPYLTEKEREWLREKTNEF